METVVFGRLSGLKAAEYAASSPMPDVPSEPLQKAREEIEQLQKRKGTDSAAAIREEMRFTMSEKVGIFRHAGQLNEALEKIKELKQRYQNVGVRDQSKSFNGDLTDVMELGYGLDIAEVIVLGAIAREESRGSHFRNDFPTRDDDKFLQHTMATQTPDGIQLSYKPVTITKWPPKERTY